jgi:hypothetical protein
VTISSRPYRIRRAQADAFPQSQYGGCAVAAIE